MSESKKNFLYVFSSYTLWGLLPLYWKLLGQVAAPIVLVHRVFWSLIFLGILLAFKKNLLSAVKDLRSVKRLLVVSFSTIFLCINWVTYVWAIPHGYVLEAGLGYFICPIFSVALGALVHKESLTKLQWLAILTVASGVLIKVFVHGTVPWIALTLAASFALYVTTRKLCVSSPLSSLFQETLVACPLVLIFSYFLSDFNLVAADTHTNILLILCGPVTAIPLLLLTAGLRTVPQTVSAMLQYIAPLLTIAIGLIYGEHLVSADYIAIPCIWLGIVLYFLGMKKKCSAMKNNQSLVIYKNEPAVILKNLSTAKN